MAKDALRGSCCYLHLCPSLPQHSGQSQPTKICVWPKSLPCSHCAETPSHSESRPESYGETPSAQSPLPKILLPRCAVGTPPLPPRLAPASPGKAHPHLHAPPTTHLLSPQPYYPLIYLLILFMSCPLHEGRGFCLFCPLTSPRVVVKIFNIRCHESRMLPLSVLSRWIPLLDGPQHLPQNKHLFNKYLLNKWINLAPCHHRKGHQV